MRTTCSWSKEKIQKSTSKFKMFLFSGGDTDTFLGKIGSFEDEEIGMLSHSLPYVISASLAQSTTSKYSRGWRKWVSWSERKSEVSTRPADPFFVAIYLNSLLFSQNTTSSLTSAYYGIRWGHRIVGLASPTSSSLVEMAYEGCLRLCSRRRTRKLLFQQGT